MFAIGDCIEYEEDLYHRSKYYSPLKYYGCIVDKSSLFEDTYYVISQNGGQIRTGISPLRKISSDKFTEKFYILDEHKVELLKEKDKLPLTIRLSIQTKLNETCVQRNKSLLSFVLRKTLVNKAISEETWVVLWYTRNILRSHEPWRMAKTLTYHKVHDLAYRFMDTNKEFMFRLQGADLPEYIIELEILEFKLKNGLLDNQTYLKLKFPILIKKLEYILKFKTFCYDINVHLVINQSGKNFVLNTTLNKLIDTKFVFPYQNRYHGEFKSKCWRRINVNIQNLEWVKIKSFKQDDKIRKLIFIESEKEVIDVKNNRTVKIKHKKPYSTAFINSTENLLVMRDNYSRGSINIKEVNLYCPISGAYLGCFELVHQDFDLVYLEDIVINGIIC